jgi:transposase InsO family protein
MCIWQTEEKQFLLIYSLHQGILYYIHSDLWGWARHPSNGGCDYMITFINDFSRKVWVYFLKHKNDALTAFKQWKALVENKTTRKLKKLRTDNGLEFCNGEFDSLCADHGIARHKNVIGTPQQNGVAEK